MSYMTQRVTIKQLLDGFDGNAPDTFRKVFGGLAPEDELIRKQTPARLLRFDEDDTAAIGVISSIRKDRDDEVLLSEGMDKTNYSGIVLWQHDYGRGEIPHATNLWINNDPPRGIPYRTLAKTQYLIELSDLGNDVYRYRLGEHPLGQSVGFRSTERVRIGQTGYDEVYKDWVKRVKKMLKAEGLKAVTGEFDQPSCIYTKWELWEYSDVYIGSNVDALQVAVKSGIISPEEAKQLVDFKTMAEADGGMGEINELRERIAALEAEIEELKEGKATPLDFEKIWNGTPADNADLEAWWNGN